MLLFFVLISLLHDQESADLSCFLQAEARDFKARMKTEDSSTMASLNAVSSMLGGWFDKTKQIVLENESVKEVAEKMTGVQLRDRTMWGAMSF